MLGDLIADAALDVRATLAGPRDFRRARSPRRCAPTRACRTPPAQFNRDRFDQALRDIRPQRARLLRRTAQEPICASRSTTPLVDGLAAPKALVDRSPASTRRAAPSTTSSCRRRRRETFAAPADDALQGLFQRPQGRAIGRPNIARSTSSLVDADARSPSRARSSDDDARALYDKVKDARFGAPEKRKLQQIVFPDEAEADDAEAKIKAGASFDDIVKARNLKPSGRRSRRDAPRPAMFDKTIADAAFALPAGGVSEVVKGQFGPAIVRVVSDHAGQRQDLRRGQGHAEEGDRRRSRRRPRADAARQDRGRARLGQDARRGGQVRRPRRARDRRASTPRAATSKGAAARPARQGRVAAPPPSLPTSASTTRRCDQRSRLRCGSK